MEIEKMKAVLESMLFVSDTPLSVKKAASILKDTTPAEVEKAFAALQEELNALGRSFQVKQVAEGFLLTTRAEYHKWARELYKVVTTTRLSRQAMEALAIIAYKQPVARAEVEAIRGVEVGSVMQTLLEKKMIRILGRAETAGRPLLYGTTHEFLVHFGLKDLTDLPRVSEIQELAGNEISPDVMKEMEGELRRREAKLGLEPMSLEPVALNPEGAVASIDTEAGEAPSDTTESVPPAAAEETAPPSSPEPTE